MLDRHGSLRVLGYAIDPVEGVTRNAEGSVDYVEFSVEVTKAADDLGVLSYPLPPVGYPDPELRLLVLQVADRPVDPISLRASEPFVARPDLVEPRVGLLDLALGRANITPAR